MSGVSGTNNNWTILSSEETVAETLRPFAAADEGHTSATDEPVSGEPNQPAKSAEGLPVEDYLVSEQAAAQRAELGSHQHSSSPPSSEVSGTSDHADEVRPMEGQAEGPAQPSSDPESSSDSYTLLTPSPDDPPAGQAEFTQAENEQTLRLRNERELQQKGEESEQHPQTADTEVNEERAEETGERRKKSLLAALEQIGRREEEEEEEEEEFQVPQQENNSIFSLNKCILGAVLLLAFGTIFFSESDHSTNELRDAEAAGKQQEWLSPEVPPHVGADSSQLLNKLAEGNQQISALQAQLQQQNEELKVAKEQAAEGVKERLLWEEVEKENSRLKTEMTSLPVLQKENDRMKRELESVPALQKELETLRSTVTKLKLSSAAGQTTQADVSLSSSPPTGQPEDNSQDAAGSTDKHSRKLWDNQKEKKNLKRDKYEMGDKKQSKELEKSVRKEGEQKELKKEWKKEKHEEGMFEKEKEKAGKHKRQSDEMKDEKREKSGRGDDGKHRKDKEERGWKKGKHENVNEGKEWKDEEKKDRQGGKQHGDTKGKEGWRGEMDWKKGKDGSKESGKEKWERKAWKETGEKREWKKNGEWKDKNRDQGKERKGKYEKKQWEDGINHGKEEKKQWNEYERKSKKQDEEWRRKDEKLDQWKSGQKEKKHNKDWKKDESHSLKNKNKHKSTGNHEHREEHLYGEQNPPHSHHRPSVDQPEYWVQQRDRLRRDPRPPQHCNSAESCAQTERLLPVTLPEFEAVLQSYLSKAEEAGVDGSKTEELKKLAADFFKDGVFVHEQMSFQDFVEDLGDVLEDLVEGDDEDQEDSALEDEMEEFEKEVMKRFSAPGGGEKEKRVKEGWRKKSGQERG